MSHATWNRALALTLLLTASAAHAQPTAPVESTEAPPAEAADAPTASDGSEATTDEAATPAEAATTAPAEAAESDEDADAERIPEGEEEQMGPHSIGNDRVRFTPGSGLDLRSDDGAFRLQTRVRGQFLYGLTDDSGSIQHQLTARRVRIAFSGNFFGEANRFKLELAISPSDDGIRDNIASSTPRNTPLLDLYFEFRQIRDFNIRVGQYKLPSNRQRVISSGDLQMVDRALMNSEFTLDRDLAIDARSGDFLGLGLLRYAAGVSVGRGRDSTGFEDFDFHYFARVEVLPFGMFDDYEESDFERAATPRLSIGAMYSFQHNAIGLNRQTSNMPADGGTTNYHLFIADAIFKYAGFSAQWELAIRTGSRNPGDAVDDMGVPLPVTDPRNGLGTMLQAGYLLPGRRIEFSGRYGAIRHLGIGGASSIPDESELGVGFSYYVAQHPFKVQLDYFRLWAGPGTLDDGANQFRIQLQGSI
ncbi:MAG: porin [Polyangiales bacterium]